MNVNDVFMAAMYHDADELHVYHLAAGYASSSLGSVSAYSFFLSMASDIPCMADDSRTNERSLVFQVHLLLSEVAGQMHSSPCVQFLAGTVRTALLSVP